MSIPPACSGYRSAYASHSVRLMSYFSDWKLLFAVFGASVCTLTVMPSGLSSDCRIVAIVA